MLRPRNIIFVGCMTLLVTSCASYQSKPISAAVEASALEARTLSDPRLHEFVSLGLAVNGQPVRPSAWNLNRLTLAAIYYHPDLDIARTKLASAKAGVVSAGQIPNPTLDVAATYNSTVLTPSPWAVGTMVNFLLETFGRRQYRIAQAEELTEAARDDLATATWQVRGQVRTALLNLWAAQRKVTLTQHRLQLQDQLVNLLENQLAAGQASALDVTRERITRNQISLALDDAERQSAEARVQLATAIGIPEHALNGVQLSFRAFERPVRLGATFATGELRRRALLGRSDVQALLAEYAAAQSALQLEIAKQFPNVNLGSGYTYDQGDNKYNLQLSAELPIFNQNQGPVAEAAAKRKNMAARFTALQAQIISAIDRAAANYRAATSALNTTESLLVAGRTRQRQIVESFKAGNMDRSAPVTADLELAAIELSRFDATVQQRQAVGALEDALQRPLFASAARLPMTEANPRIGVEPAK